MVTKFMVQDLTHSPGGYAPFYVCGTHFALRPLKNACPWPQKEQEKKSVACTPFLLENITEYVLN